MSDPREDELLERLRIIGEDPAGTGAANQKTARKAYQLLRREHREHNAVRPSVTYTLGLYYFRRSVVFEGLAGRPARKLAAKLLTPIFLDSAEPLPSDVLPVVLPECRRHAERVLRAALRDRDIEQLRKAAKYWRSIAAATPNRDPAAVNVAEGLGVSLSSLFDYTGDPAELDDIITFYRSVLAHLPAGMSVGPVRGNLALVIATRCERFGSTDLLRDLDEAIALMRTELSIPAKHGRKAVLLAQLSSVYHIRAEFTETLADVDEAVELARQAVKLAGRRHPLRPMLHLILKTALMARHMLYADPRDLAEALNLGTAADAMPSDWPNPAVAGERITTSMLLSVNASADPGSPDRDRAIDLLRTAASELADASPGKPMLLQNLAALLRNRHLANGSGADLDAAIEVAKLASALEDGADPRRQAKALMLLCGLLGARYENADDPADLDAAITAGQKAVELVPLNALPSGFVYYWALILMLKYDVYHEATDVEEALRVLRQLVTSAATPARTRTDAMIGLAQALRRPGDHALADLDETVHLLRQVLTSSETGTYQPALVEYKLATVLAKRFDREGTLQDARDSLELLDRNLQTTQLATSYRIDAAVIAAELEQKVGEPGWTSRAADRLATAVRLLPFAASRTLNRADQQRALGVWSGLAARAAALALADERPGESPEQRAVRALGLLEAGRTVLLNQAYDTRGDLDGVWRTDPTLARRFLELRRQLDHDPGDGTDELQTLSTAVGSATAAHLLALEGSAGDRRRAGLAFAKVIEQIRKLPGQSGFMQAPDLRELTAQAAHGPIVVLNVADIRSDAFLVTSAGIRTLRLPTLTPDAAADAAERLHRSAQVSDGGGMLQILDWLWSTVAEPALIELGFTHAPTAQEPWPRIWWVAGGALANMPLHAAGRYPGEQDAEHDCANGDRFPESVLGRVISSYIPSVRTLRYLYERSAHSVAQSASDGSLVVAMRQTPGTQLRDLVNAGPEAAFVAGVLPKPVLLTHGTAIDDEPAALPALDPADQPTTGRVLAELERSRIAHFACHAQADTADPSRSGLRLLDAPLTVSAISAQDLDSVMFAFLSACGTALNRAHDLLDESIHVVSALQLAGIPQVVGTLWEVDDFASLAVVQSFYARLGARSLDTSVAAETLHEITRLARDEVPDAPWIWAAHIYAGC